MKTLSRRHFLQMSGAVATIGVLAACAPVAQQPSAGGEGGAAAVYTCGEGMGQQNPPGRAAGQAALMRQPTAGLPAAHTRAKGYRPQPPALQLARRLQFLGSPQGRHLET